MRYFIALATALVFGILAGSSVAQTVGFESLTTNGPGSGCTGISGGSVVENGFTLGPGSLLACDSTGGFGISTNDSTSLGLQSDLTISRSDAVPFFFDSFDATGLFINTSTNFSANANQIIATGSLVGGGTVQSTFTLDSIGDGVGNAPDFETFLLPASFANLQSVTLQGIGTNDNNFSIDNLSVSTVPEPSMVTALFCCSIALAARRRRAIV